MEGDPFFYNIFAIPLEISIHSLRMEGDTTHCVVYLYGCTISIHSLRMEGDPDCTKQSGPRNPFQSTPSAWRETGELHRKRNGYDISIHSLRMEGDKLSEAAHTLADIFQSTPSAWRETACVPVHTHSSLFQSTPSAWRETLPRFHNPQTIACISIHSLRMEGDAAKKIQPMMPAYFNPLPPHGGRPDSHHRQDGENTFQSTPSAWRETDFGNSCRSFHTISIHSLRMEGDLIRPQTNASFFISIHSLRMEGDSKTAQESVFHFAYPCTILQKRMQKTTFCTRKNGFFRKKGEKFGAKPSASFCAPMIRTDTFPLNFSHRISGSSMSMVSFAPICSTFD